MRRSLAVLVGILVLVFIIAIVFIVQKRKISEGISTGKSEVKIIDNIPKLFIDGKEMSSNAINIYYYPPQGENHGPGYGTEEWLVKIKSLIDQAVNNKAKLILLNVWWSDLDESTTRPKNIGDNFNFSNLDAVFEYARKKDAYIIPIFTLFPFDPEWWLKENNFPPFNSDGKICDFCETDSAGNVYGNASMNADIAQRDFGGFVKAVVYRYRDNLALAGWDIGVGATGEDGYGPNYIALKAKNIDNLPKYELKANTYTDYSLFFERKFKEWLKEKYAGDQNLQSAWQDKSATLANAAIPRPSEMYQVKDLPPIFPDPTDIFAKAQNGTDGSEKLNVKGKDFYEFRNKMRREDRKYYADLIKKSDPNHILLLTGASDDLLEDEAQPDGIAFSMFGASERGMESQSYYYSTDIPSRAVKSGKIAFITNEHTCDGKWLEKTGECETPDQLDFIEDLGKSVECAGGIFAPAVGIDGKKYLTDKNVWIPPIWFSDNAMAVAKAIGNYQPSGSCVCPIASELYSENQCSTNPESSCEWFIRAYNSLCEGQKDMSPTKKIDQKAKPSSDRQGNNVSSPCGDGKCDEFEKSSNMCPLDCK